MLTNIKKGLIIVNKKPILIIVEGAIASGKSSLSKALREQLPHATLMDLSSIGNDDETNSYMYHANVMNMILDMKGYGTNFVLSRSYISNEIYARLNKKDYDNSRNFRILTNKLELLQYWYDLKIVILASNPNEYERRLSKRDKFEYVKHTKEEALAQQKQYLLIADELRDKGFDVEVINNSGITKQQLCDYVISNL